VSAEPDGPENERALERAVRALAHRDHSAASLRGKLDRAGISGAAQKNVIDRLERAGYVDDARYALDRAARLAERGYGDEWICADLEMQGVGQEVVHRAVAALEPEVERAARGAAKAGGGIPAARVLARRGFSEETVEAVLAGAIAEDTPEGVG
jgi:regulatory protein